MNNSDFMQRAQALVESQGLPLTQSNLSRAAEILNSAHGALNRAGTSLDATSTMMNDVADRMTRVNALLDNVPGLANENRSENASQLPPTSLAHSRVPPSQATIHYTEESPRSQVARKGDGVSPTRQPSTPSQRGNVREESSPNERYEVDEASERYALPPDAVSGASSPMRGSSDTGNPLDAIIAGALPFVARRAMQGNVGNAGEYIPRSPNDDAIRAAIEGPAYDAVYTREALPAPQQRLSQSRSTEDVINEVIRGPQRTQIGTATDMPTESRNVIEMPDESKLSTQHGVAIPRKGNQTQPVRTPDVIELGNDVSAPKQLASTPSDTAPTTTAPSSTEERIADNAIKQSAATDEVSKPKRARSAGDNIDRFNKLADDIKNSVGAVEVRRTTGHKSRGAGKIIVETTKGEVLGEFTSAQEARAAMQDMKQRYAALRSGVESATRALRSLKR